MAVNKHEAFVVVLLGVALAGCSSEVRELREAAAPTLCTVSDSDRRTYEATEIEPLNALNTALYQCTLAARDPTTCEKVACAPER
jgi:hypothetical protein